MAVLTYKGGKYRNLAGNRIYDGTQWREMTGSSKIYLNGTWHNLGWQKAELPDVPDIPVTPELPSWDDFTHLATEEPTTGNVYYMTPTGAGNKDGSSWDNAWDASQIHVAMLNIEAGSRLYMAEGDYGTLEYPITFASAISFYGGFIANDYTWESRDAFNHPTVWRGTGEFQFIVQTDTADVILDGVTLYNFALTLRFNTGYNCTLINTSICGDTEGTVFPATFTNSRFHSDNGGAVGLKEATNCIFTGCEEVSMPIHVHNINSSTIRYCHPYYKIKYSANDVDRYRMYYDISDSVCADVTFDGGYCLFEPNSVKQCVFIRVSLVSSHPNVLVAASFGRAEDSVFIDCCGGLENYTTGITNNIIIRSKVHGYLSGLIVDSVIDNAYTTNANYKPTLYYAYVVNSTVCVRSAVISLIINSQLIDAVSGFGSCTIVNSSCDTIRTMSSGVFWNNNGTLSSGLTSAQSAYGENNLLTLGYNNTIAQFTDTGYAPAIGIQDVGDCPNPVNDPEGFADYIASFGDWHPQASSFLVGKGVYSSEYPTDLDGVTRPDPPTLGAYEPVPAETKTEEVTE